MVVREDHAVAPEVGTRVPTGALVSTSALSSPEASGPPVGFFSHLMTADQLVNPGGVSTCVTLCGKDVHVGSVGASPLEHCPGCRCVTRFCAQCVREAGQWSAES